MMSVCMESLPRVIRLTSSRSSTEAREVRGLALDHVAAPRDLRRGLVVHRHDAEGVADRGERVAQLVGQHREEFREVAALLLEVLDALLLREVAHHFREPAQPPFLVMKGGDDDLGPELRAVLLTRHPMSSARRLSVAVRSSWLGRPAAASSAG
jgi:hypothetical protein